MRGLHQHELNLLLEVQRTGDFSGHANDSTHPNWDVFDVLEERGLVMWADGPITRALQSRLKNETGTDFSSDPDLQELDPVVTAMGRLALECHRLLTT